MNWFRNLRIEVKFIGAFVVVASIAAVVGFIGIRNMSVINDLTDKIYKKELLGMSHIKQANIDLLFLIREEKNIMLASSEAERQKFLEQSNQYEASVLKSMEQAKPLFYTEKGKELFTKLEKAWEENKSVHKQVVDLAMKENPAEKRASIDLSNGLGRQKRHALDDIISELTQLKADNARNASVESSQIYSSSRTFMIIFSIAGFLVGIGLGTLMTLNITRPIKRIIDGLSEGADQVSSASGQVASASQELAEGASEQAAAIEETSSSLEEMSSMTKQNADNARQADQLMASTKDSESRSTEMMNRLTTSMGEISRASEETSKIIKTIDEIAFQTNLLALNAAVEAARAGEAGAGFAVVADEVRNLAMRAAEAAKNTADLIEGTVKKVQDGSVLVEQTEKEFRAVALNFDRFNALTGQISAASLEQAQGIEQINRAVGEMDKVVQQNAASAEEAASASEEMNAQAEQMKEFVVELRTLVDGSNSNSAARSAAAIRRKTAARGTARSTRVTAIHAKANSVSPKGIGKDPGPSTRPDLLIPFDDGEISEF
jgi:methyl-accepting chemotaxis protein